MAGLKTSRSVKNRYLNVTFSFIKVCSDKLKVGVAYSFKVNVNNILVGLDFQGH